MKTVYVHEKGIFPSPDRCCADAVSALIESCGDDCELVFPAGVYFLKKRIPVSGRKNLTLRGENATFRIHFDNTDLSGLDGAFSFEHCENLSLQSLHFDTDVSPNISGMVVRNENGCFDVRFFDEFPLTGSERLEAINTVDEECTPDYRFVTYDVVEHTWLGDNTYRFEAEKVGADLTKLPVGSLVNIRHCRYGAPLVTFANVEGALIEDVRITAAPGCVFVINPRCADFTFRRYRIELPDNTKRTMASNADGIHIAGITGSFVMEECYFENMGDDALNIHSKACMVTDIEPERHSLSCHLVRPISTKDPSQHRDGEDNIVRLEKFPMGENWTRPGDLMYVYDQQTLQKMGEIRVTAYHDTTMSYEIVSGTVEKGHVLANSAYYASARISRCTARNTRARAFLIQTDNAVIENCHIYGMAFSAFLLSPDISYWYEVGPCTNVVIRDNLIEKCTTCVHRSNIGAIVLKCRHEEGISDSPAGVHNHIRIENNTFRNIGDCAVFALAVRDLTVQGNRFEDCCNLPFDEAIELLKYDVSLVNCDRVEVSGNSSTHDEAYRLYCRNVTGLVQE